jgi:hypothetical protein
MMRKLTLTGAVLLIHESAEQARVIVALMTSITFLTVRVGSVVARTCHGGSSSCTCRYPPGHVSPLHDCPSAPPPLIAFGPGRSCTSL